MLVKQLRHFLEPHIGHLYSSVIADAIKRWNQLIQSDVKVVLSTGTDEHGTKIQRSAKLHNTTVEAYCQEISSKYRLMSDAFNISYTDFIRTSENRHKLTVQQFWVRVASNFWNSKCTSYYHADTLGKKGLDIQIHLSRMVLCV